MCQNSEFAEKNRSELFLQDTRTDGKRWARTELRESQNMIVNIFYIKKTFSYILNFSNLLNVNLKKNDTVWNWKNKKCNFPKIYFFKRPYIMENNFSYKRERKNKMKIRKWNRRRLVKEANFMKWWKKAVASKVESIDIATLST